MATDELVDALKQELNNVLQYTDTELINRSVWGEINFESARPDIQAALSDASDLSGLPLEELTHNAINDIQASIPQVAKILEEIDKFSIASGGSPSDFRDDFCNQLREAVEQLRNSATSYIPYLAYKRGDVSESIAKFEGMVASAQKAYEEAEAWVDDKKEKIEKIESAARAAAASAGVGTFTSEFDDEATKVQGQSKAWLRAACGLAISTIVAAICFYFWPKVAPDSGVWDPLRLIASKAVIVMVLFTGAVWCGRIYRALVHQATVNKHRALSLKTFQAFVEATDDPYVKDAVLMAATRTVFGSVPTGFAGTDGTQDSGVNFVEFGRSAVEKAASKSNRSD